MKWLEKITSRATQTASQEVKNEIRKSLWDLLPFVVTVGLTIISTAVFHKAIDVSDDRNDASGSIVNNFFFIGDDACDTSKSIIDSIWEETIHG